MLKRSDVTREVLLNFLSKGICKVHFRKITNGRYRSIYCTLVPNMMPITMRKGINEVFDPNIIDYDLLAVYDVVSHGWKSFRLSTVLNFYNTNELKESATENSKISIAENSYL